MATLLHVEASPRNERSHSLEIARAFLESYHRNNLADEIDILDIWSIALPAFEDDALEARYAIQEGRQLSEPQSEAWEPIKRIFHRFAEADKYVFSLPMWNFGIPYKLKHFIDAVTQPGLAFTITEDGGHHGLIEGRPAVVIYARGYEYSATSGAESGDFQKPYLEQWLRFIGFTEIHSIVIESTLGDSPQRDEIKSRARQQAEQLALEF